MEYLLWVLIACVIVLIIIIFDIWSLLRVPALAQRKGYNVYAWIGLAWFLGIISYFILKGLAYNNKLSTDTVDSRPKATINNVLPQNNKNVISKTTNTYNQQKVSYSAWVCPKCGEKNNYAAKNCINCFEPRP